MGRPVNLPVNHIIILELVSILAWHNQPSLCGCGWYDEKDLELLVEMTYATESIVTHQSDCGLCRHHMGPLAVQFILIMRVAYIALKLYTIHCCTSHSILEIPDVVVY